jgi:protein BUR2
MASIDRYRPAGGPTVTREGYQPPAPPQSRQQDHPSRSPARRREVPPAVPTPPHHNRTSPPRLQGRPTSQQHQSQQQQPPPPPPAHHTSPAQSNAQASLASMNQWFFTTEEIHSTPTIVEGVSPSEERLRRAKGVNFIYQAGVMLDLPQITLWVAGVFFHRFYMRYSMAQEKGGIHHYVGSPKIRTSSVPMLTTTHTHTHNLSIPSTSISPRHEYS